MTSQCPWLEGSATHVKCCDLAHLRRTCRGCEDQPTWHAALRCPMCGGTGEGA
jgi:hypothetical protein